MKAAGTTFLMPEPIMGPMPNGDAEDPPVHQIALDAALRIEKTLKTTKPALRATAIQLGVIEAINRALDRMQELGGRRRS